ncbi:hypothetical protein Tsubulata_038326 [Turnera subulata]|uniref:CCHC-type domain-containing protein n=1 Tax=Turnera subulata TaxID=218843 RepID=A0A9Q0JDX4_9ROSI|nr:hypothetical protein Tsubulata_038326 [Turnera subulata]
MRERERSRSRERVHVISTPESCLEGQLLNPNEAVFDPMEHKEAGDTADNRCLLDTGTPLAPTSPCTPHTVHSPDTHMENIPPSTVGTTSTGSSDRSETGLPPAAPTEGGPTQKFSYLEKLTVGTDHNLSHDPWEDEGEVEVEEGDVFVNEIDGVQMVELTDAFKARLDKPWERAVIVKLLGRPIGFCALQNKIESLWRPRGPYKIIDLAYNYYIVRFWEESDFQHALIDGPWMILGHVLSVQPWSDSFRANTDKIDRVVCWIQFPDFPVNRYHSKIFRVLDNLVGRTVKLDANVKNPDRACFAKVAVSIDLTKPLKNTIMLDGEPIRVTYDGLPDICVTCGRIGHSALACPSSLDAAVPTSNPSPPSNQPSSAFSTLQPPANLVQHAPPTTGDNLTWMNVPKAD